MSEDIEDIEGIEDIEHVMQFFARESLPPELQPLHELARGLAEERLPRAAIAGAIAALEALPCNRERGKALRCFKAIRLADPPLLQLDILLAAKEAAMRAMGAR